MAYASSVKRLKQQAEVNMSDTKTITGITASEAASDDDFA